VENPQNKPNKFSINPTAKLSTWCDMVMGKIIKERLTFFKPPIVNDKHTVVMEEEDLQASEKIWTNSILIYLVGKRPYYVYLKAYIERTWMPKGKFQFFARENGFYLIQFEKEEDCNNILTGGPWMMDGKLIIMRKWNSRMKYDKNLLLNIPIWVRFPNLNFAY